MNNVVVVGFAGVYRQYKDIFIWIFFLWVGGWQTVII